MATASLLLLLLLLLFLLLLFFGFEFLALSQISVLADGQRYIEKEDEEEAAGSCYDSCRKL